MSSVLRNLDTGLFYANGQWTADPRVAEPFADEESARMVATKLSLTNADLVGVDRNGKVVSGTPIRISD